VDPGGGLPARARPGRRDRPPRGRARGAATSPRPLTVFFDFDGTLVDVRARHYRTYRSALAPLGGRPLHPAAYWRLKRRGAGLAEVLARSGVAPEGREEFLDRFLAEIEAPASLALDRLLPGAEATLAALRGRGDRLVLLSLRRSRAAFAGQVERLGIAGAFARVDAGRAHEDGGLAKRDLIERAGFGAAAAVVGDTEADVAAARALGLAPVGVTTGLRNRRFLLAAGAAAVVDRIAQAPAALDGVLGRLPGRPIAASRSSGRSAREGSPGGPGPVDRGRRPGPRPAG
jgi:phosphoglycolate phosphatase